MNGRAWLISLCIGGALGAGVLQAQVGERFPQEPVPPIIVPFEPGGAEVDQHTRELDSRPFPPHKAIGNIYYIGMADYGSWLITSDEGHILIDPTFEHTVPLIRKNVEELGFNFTDIKVILQTHAHGDHAGGAALVKKLTAAKLFVMDGDAETMTKGIEGIPAVKVDRVLHDKDEIRVGPLKIVAYDTPGHTPGNTTYAWQSEADGKTYNVVLIGSLTTMATQLRDDDSLVDMYRHQFKLMRELPCDVFLAPHGKMFGLSAKYARVQAEDPNAYIDPLGYTAHVDMMEKSFYYKLDWAHR